MPCPCPSRPVRNRRTPAAVVGSCLLGLLMLLAAPGAGQAEQLWSVHAFGIKVGELRVTMSQDAGQYQGNSLFQTTGVAGLFKRIPSNITFKPFPFFRKIINKVPLTLMGKLPNPLFQKVL